MRQVADCSSGGGAALARHYAKQGAHLWLVGSAPPHALTHERAACLALGAASVTLVPANPWAEEGWAAVRDGLLHGGQPLLEPLLEPPTAAPPPPSQPPYPSPPALLRSTPRAVAVARAVPPFSSTRLRPSPTPPSTPPPLRRSARAALTPRPALVPLPAPSLASPVPLPAPMASSPGSGGRRVKHGSCSDESVGNGSLDLLVLASADPAADQHSFGAKGFGGLDDARAAPTAAGGPAVAFGEDAADARCLGLLHDVPLGLAAARRWLQVHYVVSPYS